MALLLHVVPVQHSQSDILGLSVDASCGWQYAVVVGQVSPNPLYSPNLEKSAVEIGLCHFQTNS